MNTMTTTLRPRAERRSGAVQPGPCTTSPDRVLGSGPMYKGTIEKAVALAGTDGEWTYNAQVWTGSLTLGVGSQAWKLTLDQGTISGPVEATAGPGAGEDIVVTGTTEAWANFLTTPAGPGYVDFFAAAGMGAMTLAPWPHDAPHHLALRRFGDLLRHAANGTDPAPQVQPNVSRHGQHESAVGRYIHLDLDGVDHRVYYETAGQGIGLLCQHTAGADGRQYRHLLEDERVTSKYQVVVYDLPGHGKSLPPQSQAWWTERYSLSQKRAMDVPTTLAAALGLHRPVFIGSSVGGMLALDLARYHADDYRAVISLEGGLKVVLPGGLDTTSQRARTDEDPAAHAAVMMMIMASHAPETFRQETRFHYAQGAPGIFNGDIDYYTYEHDLSNEAENIDTSRCGVHLLTGEYDFMTVPWTEEAGRRIKGSTCQIMKGLGHFPMSEDHEQLMDYALPILDDIAAGKGPQ